MTEYGNQNHSTIDKEGCKLQTNMEYALSLPIEHYDPGRLQRRRLVRLQERNEADPDP